MTEQAPDMRRWAPSIEPYAEWIDRTNYGAARLWASALRDGTREQVEAAIAEAVAWDWLSNRVDAIELGLSGTSKSPDFRCRVGDQTYFVEVTNIARDRMTAATGLDDNEIVRFKSYGSPADRLHHEILGKEKQGRGLTASYLVFVTTLHWNGSILLMHRGHLGSVLHSQEFLSGNFDPNTGRIDDWQNVVDFRRAAFTTTRTLNKARSHVSGALFGPFGLYPDGVRVHGILNPEADHPFDPALLPDAPFGHFAVWPPQRQVDVEWTDDLRAPRATGRVDP